MRKISKSNNVNWEQKGGSNPPKNTPKPAIKPSAQLKQSTKK